MCVYQDNIRKVIDGYYASGTAFNALMVRDAVRALVGPSVDVSYIECKHEMLSYCERTLGTGNAKGWRMVSVEVVAAPHLTEVSAKVWHVVPAKWRPKKVKVAAEVAA